MGFSLADRKVKLHDVFRQKHPRKKWTLETRSPKKTNKRHKGKIGRPFSGDFQGPPTMGPLYGKFPILLPLRDSYGSSMGIVWETYHKRVPLLGVPGITLDISAGVPVPLFRLWFWHHALWRHFWFGWKLAWEPGDLLFEMCFCCRSVPWRVWYCNDWKDFETFHFISSGM